MIPAQCQIAVQLNAACVEQCQQLAAELSLPLVEPGHDDSPFPYLLMVSDAGVALQQTGPKAPGPVTVDFVSGAASYRRNKGGGELIVKAVSGDKQQRPTVVDATAGLGRDSFVLASWGYPVTMCERSAVVSQLLADGLLRAAQSDDSALQAVINRMQLHRGDAVSYLSALSETARPDVVVIDPMFPASTKSALVKKEMRAFHQVVGADSDSEKLLDIAMSKARHRVVVKRPRKSAVLAGKKPNFAVEGKAIRFDIYTIKAFAKK